MAIVIPPVVKLFFTSGTDAARVASHEHTVDGRKLQVCIYTPPQMMPDRVLVRGLPDVNFGEELKLYMEARSDSDVDSILYGDGGVAVVIFTGNIGKYLLILSRVSGSNIFRIEIPFLCY